MSLLRKLSKLEKYEIFLPNIGHLYIYVLCTKLDDKVQQLLRAYEGHKDVLVSLIPVFIAERYSYEEMLTALLEAYTLVYHGHSKAKIKGLETLRILCRERNLGKVAKQCGAKTGEEVITLIASNRPLEDILTELQLRECTIKTCTNEVNITEIALFPIEARLFKIHSDIDVIG